MAEALARAGRDGVTWRPIWISWERHRRTREIASALDVRLLEIRTARRGPPKYFGLLARTTVAVLRQRPTHVFIQCPSLVLAFWMSLLKLPLGFMLVADLHNEAVVPFICQARWYAWLVRRIHRSADLSIVTNEALRSVVQSNGGRAVVLPDRVPRMEKASGESNRSASEPANVVFVCTFAPDEPFVEVFRAAERLKGRATIHVTGDCTRLPQPVDVPDNVRFTGFLPDAAYEAVLRSADAMVDLTTMEDCLVCGGYEAVALAKPLVTSDTKALRTFFHLGAVYTRHDAESIASSIEAALARRAELALQMDDLRNRLDCAWELQRRSLVERLASAHDRSRHRAVVPRSGWVSGRR